jgi:16S rRNA (guanine527-N7)-methyltransferase
MANPSPAKLSAETIRSALGEFQVLVSDSQVLQIQQYMDILLTWNEKINLTAIRDPLEILNRHFCECMYAASAVPLEVGRLADVGSGGGFPVCRSKSSGRNCRSFLSNRTSGRPLFWLK